MSPLLRAPLTIEHALLGFVREEALHGYEIYRRLGEADGPGLVWRIKQSQLYALLGRLEADGYLSASHEPQPARPARKVYQLTDAGRAAFEQWLAAPVAHGRQLRLDFLLKLYFAQRAGGPAARDLIAAQRAVCRRWLAAAERAAVAESPYTRLVQTFRAGQIEAMLAWLDQCEQTIQAARS